MNRVIRHGKGVDYPIRLVKRGTARYSGRQIHEELLVDGKVGVLKHGMIHDSSPTFISRLKKMKRDVDAEEQYFGERRHGVTFNTLFVIPVKHFISYLIKHDGWRDGPKGCVVIFLSAIQLFWLEVRFLRFRWFKR